MPCPLTPWLCVFLFSRGAPRPSPFMVQSVLPCDLSGVLSLSKCHVSGGLLPGLVVAMDLGRMFAMDLGAATRLLVCEVRMDGDGKPTFPVTHTLEQAVGGPRFSLRMGAQCSPCMCLTRGPRPTVLIAESEAGRVQELDAATLDFCGLLWPEGAWGTEGRPPPTHSHTHSHPWPRVPQLPLPPPPPQHCPVLPGLVSVSCGPVCACGGAQVCTQRPVPSPPQRPTSLC